MTDRDLIKMTRKELLELLIAVEKENNELRERLDQLEEELQTRDIQREKAGTMAEAALALNGLFESTDKAAAEYLENIKRCSEEQQNKYDSIVGVAEQKAKAILDEAESERQRKIDEADAYWNKLSSRLEAFYNEHAGMREMLLAEADKNLSKNK